jgi:hypothetical protein
MDTNDSSDLMSSFLDLVVGVGGLIVLGFLVIFPFM